ncbi:RING-H2 finger protein ATL58-like isoform X1 [Phoenix dactylifera]|uniref:RING-type E3 ubiquitin transferase n=1 Tax=Phoenix dactylifera TaxID=42345 RepID=A0A8B7CAR5_PHODC|nr:RING-H2 finger protein ATL58-like isoform X1 [Phoenix dactylifera]
MSCSSPDPASYCSTASPELKLYQAFIFSVPVFFTFVLLILFYVFYLKRRRANWQSLRMRASHLGRGEVPRSSESGIKKEVREMLPIVIFKASFLIRETQCSVCLGDYRPNDKLQRIPQCGHTFHVGCIDHWLATNTTCPLCRASLLPVTKAAETNLPHHESQTTGEANLQEQSSERLIDERVAQHDIEATERQRDLANEDCSHLRGEEECRHDGEVSIAVNC